MCYVTEESRVVVLKRSGGRLELKLNWNVNYAFFAGKCGDAVWMPSPLHSHPLYTPRRNNGDWWVTNW